MEYPDNCHYLAVNRYVQDPGVYLMAILRTPGIKLFRDKNQEANKRTVPLFGSGEIN